MEGGTIVLRDPSGHVQEFYYGGLGVGLALGFRIPKLPKLPSLGKAIQPNAGTRNLMGSVAATQKKGNPMIKASITKQLSKVTGNVGPMSFPSIGEVLLGWGLSRSELTRPDVQGWCMFAEIGGGLIGGGSATGMFIGLDPMHVAKMAAGGAAPQILESARGLILMAACNVGFQAGGGITDYIGYLS